MSFMWVYEENCETYNTKKECIMDPSSDVDDFNNF